MILIFDKNGEYVCQTDTIANASRITHAKAPNICKCLKGYKDEVNMQTNGFFFLEKKHIYESQHKIEKILKIIIAYESVRGLPKRIKAISKILNTNVEYGQ